MNDLQIFNYSDKQVRTINKDGEPWFVAKDACDILEISNGRDAVSRLDEDEKDAVGITDAIGREQQTTIISESGLYSLIMTSRKEEAEQFKRWIRKEVIPSIRKTGSYITKPVSPLEALRYTVEALEQQAQRMDKLETTQQAIKEAVISEPDNWREDINHKMNKIAEKIGTNQYREVRSESYKLLELRAGVNLERRLDNKRARMLKEGASKTAIDNTRKIDVIDEDKKLREIYGKIVGEFLIKFVA
jgi:prophage antirepressor-like protein